MNDLRFAVRMLWRSPAFCVIAIATLALGIGANTAIFSVIESALLRPLPFPKADRLVRLYETFEENGTHSDLLNLSEKTVRQWRQYGGDIFEGIGVATGASVTAANPGQPAQSFQAARISANFLNVLGLQPALGRNFTAAEDQPSGPRVVIVSYDFWQRNLGGRADVFGNTITLDLRPKLLIIAAAALCALLIAAANFAGLMLARVVERDGELALRSALGATRGRLIREGLAQTIVLAVLGTACGLLIAGWLTPALVALSPEGADATGSAIREFDYGVRLDWPVFVFAAGAMLLIGVGFGLLPAWRAARTDLQSSLGNIGRGSTLDGGTRRLLGGLIVVEIAIAAVLLMSSLMLTQYFRKVVREPWGFATERRLIFNAMLSDRLFTSQDARKRSIDATLGELRALPGVRSVSVTAPSPMEAARDLIGCVPEGSQPPEPRATYLAYMRGTTGGIASWALMRIIHHQWPDVPVADQFIWLGAAFVLSGAVAIACWLPARRALAVDPIQALRTE